MSRKNLTILAILLFTLVAGAIGFLLLAEDNDTETEDQENQTTATETISMNTVRVSTSQGEFTIELNSEAAPQTSANFKKLVEEDFYDGLTFHRYEPGFVLQGGDPNGDGTGGPGYTIPAELDNGLTHEVGAVAMARLSDTVNPEKASSGSQFYIVIGEASFLDGEYTVFGKVTDGFDVIEKLRAGDTMEKLEL